MVVAMSTVATMQLALVLVVVFDSDAAAGDYRALDGEARARATATTLATVNVGAVNVMVLQQSAQNRVGNGYGTGGDMGGLMQCRHKWCCGWS